MIDNSITGKFMPKLLLARKSFRCVAEWMLSVNSTRIQIIYLLGVVVLVAVMGVELAGNGIMGSIKGLPFSRPVSCSNNALASWRNPDEINIWNVGENGIALKAPSKDGRDLCLKISRINLNTKWLAVTNGSEDSSINMLLRTASGTNLLNVIIPAGKPIGKRYYIPVDIDKSGPFYLHIETENKSATKPTVLSELAFVANDEIGKPINGIGFIKNENIQRKKPVVHVTWFQWFAEHVTGSKNTGRLLTILLLVAFAFVYALVKKYGARWEVTLLALILVLVTALFFNGWMLMVWSRAQGMELSQIVTTKYVDIGNYYYGLEGARSLLETGQWNWNGMFYRMPGYFFFVGAIIKLFNHGNLNYVSNYMDVVTGQLLLKLAAVVLFGAVCFIRLRPIAAVVCAFLAATFLDAIYFVQVDSVITSLWLFVLSALIWITTVKNSDKLKWSHAIMLNIPLLLMYAMRTDIIPVWLFLNGFLFWRARRFWLLPVLMLSALAFYNGSFLNYKTLGLPFVLSTNNTGHVMFVGLWQVPENPFVWKATDESYNKWVNEHGYTYGQRNTNEYAVKQVLRFYVTYPFYTTYEALHKLISYLHDGLTLDLQDYSPIPHHTKLHRLIVYFSIILLVIAVFKKINTMQMISIGAPVGISLPIFSILQATGRFTGFIGLSCLVVFGLIITNQQFICDYAKNRRFYVKLFLIGIFVVILLLGVQKLLEINPKLLTTSPFLNPLNSSLSVLK